MGVVTYRTQRQREYALHALRGGWPLLGYLRSLSPRVGVACVQIVVQTSTELLNKYCPEVQLRFEL
eukprot:scaffold881_cov387-Prasinococcus_capsulatus_cf.AAC.6